MVKFDTRPAIHHAQGRQSALFPNEQRGQNLNERLKRLNLKQSEVEQLTRRMTVRESRMSLGATEHNRTLLETNLRWALNFSKADINFIESIFLFSSCKIDLIWVIYSKQKQIQGPRYFLFLSYLPKPVEPNDEALDQSIELANELTINLVLVGIISDWRFVLFRSKDWKLS